MQMLLFEVKLYKFANCHKIGGKQIEILRFEVFAVPEMYICLHNNETVSLWKISHSTKWINFMFFKLTEPAFSMQRTILPSIYFHVFQNSVQIQYLGTFLHFRSNVAIYLF